jgi:DNA-binding GntR family transcriptional regulator
MRRAGAPRRAPRPRAAPLLRLSDEQIHREIYRAIVEHRLAPGTKLGEDQLGRIFGVSRTRMRPILRQLARARIVVIEPRRGAFVARPSLDEARAVNGARQILEAGVARQLAPRLTRAQLDALAATVEEERRARLRGDVARAHVLTGEFHLQLAGFTGNEVVVELLRDLVSRDSLAVAMYQQDTAHCSLTGHAELIEVLARGDGEAAAASMTRHLEEIRMSLSVDPNGGEHALDHAFAHLARARR